MMTKRIVDQESKTTQTSSVTCSGNGYLHIAVKEMCQPHRVVLWLSIASPCCAVMPRKAELDQIRLGSGSLKLLGAKIDTRTR